MKRLAATLALAAIGLTLIALAAVSYCNNDTELRSMNFDRHVTVGDAVQSVADQAPANPFR